MREASEGWRRLALAAEACGGCGAQVVASDGAYFITRLAPENAAEFSHVGLAVVANGEGRKIAIAIFGAR